MSETIIVILLLILFRNIYKEAFSPTVRTIGAAINCFVKVITKPIFILDDWVNPKPNQKITPDSPHKEEHIPSDPITVSKSAENGIFSRCTAKKLDAILHSYIDQKLNKKVTSDLPKEEQHALPLDSMSVSELTDRIKRESSSISDYGILSNSPINLQTERGKIFSIGRVKVPKIPKFFDYEIPAFRFIVIEDNPDNSKDWEGGRFIATCIDLRIDGYGCTPEEALREMSKFVGEYVFKIFKSNSPETAWNYIFSLCQSNPQSSALWDKYNIAQIELAKHGKATDSDRYDTFKLQIEKLNKKVIELRITIEKQNVTIDELHTILTQSAKLNKTTKKHRTESSIGKDSVALDFRADLVKLNDDELADLVDKLADEMIVDKQNIIWSKVT